MTDRIRNVNRHDFTIALGTWFYEQMVPGTRIWRERIAWQGDATEGFMWVRIEGNSLRAEFIDKFGTENFVRELTR